ncbi:hypothetical protein GWO43_24445 [candidate division KSB1 bacterium]|nr:hypothetical protein [candidate division KSB1 bacterium]NIR69048.1 hypothetical protein [candidate division KSB1 bacterium]NIS25616.1 hypothetical protein [candidate division KSB1 bacterium]NIT73966.1 hypothetical protein [candidate division KSB1 bacterium]NIU26293.1 hypothetical protein [candidate division KSB1 bacterium]
MKRLKKLKWVTTMTIIWLILSALSIAIIRSTSQQRKEQHARHEQQG